MTFISLEFTAFFAVFFVLFWFVFNRRAKGQNWLLLIGSYIFYGWWDWRFLILIMISSLCDFEVGKAMARTKSPKFRKRLLYVSLAVNLGILGFFKYFNFFLDSFKSLIAPLYTWDGFSTLDIILPVGISFYTLQTLSYTIDVYRGKIEATDDALSFFAFVSFFPQLVAGPIERAGDLLPQFQRERTFNYDQAADGMRQAAWGFFKKMVVADNCGIYMDAAIGNYENVSGATLLFASFCGGVRLYCDFSGYSDIAIGTARVLGFNLSKNFDYPYFARNMSEFWRKWHITLISWFNDYILLWLKGRTRYKIARNIFVIFFVSGFWHGANWTFVIWGIIHALLFLPLIFFGRKRYRHPPGHNRILPTWREFFAMSKVFWVFTIVGILFVSKDLTTAFGVWRNFIDPDLFTIPEIPAFEIIFVIPLFVVEWWQRTRDHGLDFTGRKLSSVQRWAVYFLVVFTVLLYGGQPTEFIYFQF